MTPSDPLRIVLTYTGPDVENGSMPIADVVEALDGFAGAYGKLALQVTPDAEHQLRVSTVKPGSFEVVILAWFTAGQAAAQIAALKTISESVRWIVTRITGVIEAKKHVRNQPYITSVKGDGNTVVVINNQNAKLGIPVETFKVFESKLIDSDLGKIVGPLIPQKIDSARISACDETGEVTMATITSEERDFFRRPDSTITSKETEINGLFVSLNKESNRGTFKLTDGKKVPYHYRGDRPEQFHVDFSYHGAVRVTCVAAFDETLTVTQLEILSVRRLQETLPL